MSQSKKTRYKWDEINWRRLERSIFKLQKRIYRASEQKDEDALSSETINHIMLNCSLSEESLRSTKARKLLELTE